MVKACKGVIIMKKSISQSKVNRMRNIVSGNYHSKTKLRSGYTTKRVIREEGDVWEERGKKWTIIDGIKQTINTLDAIRLSNKPPLCCPQCNKRMKRNLDKQYWTLFKFCSDCVAVLETNIKKTGKSNWEKYVKKEKSANFATWLKDITEEYKEFLKSRGSKTMISEAGDIEDWMGGQTNEELEENFNNRIKEILELKNEKLK